MTARRLSLWVGLALLSAGSAVVPPARAALPLTVASIQDGGMCWLPDIEFPVPCDDDDD